MGLSISYSALLSVNTRHLHELSEASTAPKKLWVNIKHGVQYALLFPFSLIEGIIRIFSDCLAYFGVRTTPEFRFVCVECFDAAFTSISVVLDTLKTEPSRLLPPIPKT